MATYILPQELHSEVLDTLLMGAGFAQAIDRLGGTVIGATDGELEESDCVMAMIGLARQLATSIQAIVDRLDSVNLEKLADERVER